jgi:hypothetical protein
MEVFIALGAKAWDVWGGRARETPQGDEGGAAPPSDEPQTEPSTSATGAGRAIAKP